MSKFKITHVVSALIIFIWAFFFQSSAALCADLSCSDSIFYYNVSRTSFSKFNEKEWITGKLYLKHSLPRRINILSYEPIVVSLHNCSNKYYRCVYGLFTVFAVPRARLTPHSTYEVSGAKFKVQKCISGNSKICQAALISSECEGMDYNSEGCVGLNHKHDMKYPGPTLYFIYNKDFGVTAYGEADSYKLQITSIKEKMSIGSKYILSGNFGILQSRGHMHCQTNLHQQ